MGVKNLRKKSVGKGQKNLICRGGSVMGGVNFSRGVRKFWVKMSKVHSHSIKNNYSNMF